MTSPTSPSGETPQQDRAAPPPRRLVPVKGGYHAEGEGWAVFGRTPEEAAENFLRAQRRHKQIMARGIEWERQP